MRKLTIIFLTACLLPMIPLADPADDIVEGEKTGINNAITSEKPEKLISNDDLKTEEGSSKKFVISSSQELNEEEETDLQSMSKFNYLFYFIYKYKYQDKMLIEQELEDKL